jgi:hypothetical protein
MKTRQSRPCSGHRTDGEPCDAFAMTGQQVCRAHGGAAGQTRRAATMTQIQAAVRRLMADAQRRYERRYRAWLTQKVATAARVMDRPVEFFFVDGRPVAALLAWAEHQPGWPANFPPEPQLADCVHKGREAAVKRMVESANAALRGSDGGITA